MPLDDQKTIKSDNTESGIVVSNLLDPESQGAANALAADACEAAREKVANVMASFISVARDPKFRRLIYASAAMALVSAGLQTGLTFNPRYARGVLEAKEALKKNPLQFNHFNMTLVIGDKTDADGFIVTNTAKVLSRVINGSSIPKHVAKNLAPFTAIKVPEWLFYQGTTQEPAHSDEYFLWGHLISLSLSDFGPYSSLFNASTFKWPSISNFFMNFLPFFVEWFSIAVMNRPEIFVEQKAKLKARVMSALAFSSMALSHYFIQVDVANRIANSAGWADEYGYRSAMEVKQALVMPDCCSKEEMEKIYFAGLSFLMQNLPNATIPNPGYCMDFKDVRSCSEMASSSPSSYFLVDPNDTDLVFLCSLALPLVFWGGYNLYLAYRKYQLSHKSDLAAEILSEPNPSSSSSLSVVSSTPAEEAPSILSRVRSAFSSVYSLFPCHGSSNQGVVSSSSDENVDQSLLEKGQGSKHPRSYGSIKAPRSM